MRHKILNMIAAFGAIAIAMTFANISFFWIINTSLDEERLARAHEWISFLQRENVKELTQSTNQHSGELNTNTFFSAMKLEKILRFEILSTKGSFVSAFHEGRFHNGTDASSIAASLERVINGEGNTVDLLTDQKTADGVQYTVITAPILSESGERTGIGRLYVQESSYGLQLKRYATNLDITLTILFIVVPAYFAYRMIKNSTAAEKSLNQLKYAAAHDSLIGLLNRRAFSAQWQEQTAEATREDMGMALIAVDIDHFKKINDEYSHATGDAYIIHIAGILKEVMGPNDFAARLGGDEFIIAFSYTDKQRPGEMAARICQEAAKPVDLNGYILNGSVSVGTHLSNDHGLTLDERMSMADFALYQAKSAGRARYSNYSMELASQSKRRSQIEEALRDAIAKDYFFLVFQPKIDAATLQCLGFEALLRMRLPGGEVVSPVEFIPIMEEIGLAPQIGAWVLRLATRVAATWPGDKNISVNLSAAQFTRDDLREIVSDALASSKLEPGRLELEVTESVLIENKEVAEKVLDSLRELGVAISIDDFGTGYSSLGYLWRFGFDKIKIDRSFVLGLNENKSRTINILQSIVMLGRRLGMHVLVEGVETAEQVETLQKIGIDSFQGFYFSRPMPETDIVSYLRDANPNNSANPLLRFEQTG